MSETLETPQGRRIAYDLTPGRGPAVVFLGGFMSDKEGTKAVHLEDWAKREGRAFLRFDYSGHGSSSEAFEAGCIGDWYEDALAALELLDGPAVLVGSSMGGWISLLVAREHPEKVAGFVGIAAAPDFTEAMWAEFTEEQRREIGEQGVTRRPSDYGDPYPITRRLIEDGRERRVLEAPLSLPFAVRLLQGTEDEDVETEVPLRLIEHADGEDMRLTLVKGADHRFSTPECLGLVTDAIVDVSA